jgi:hypothetical protein
MGHDLGRSHPVPHSQIGRELVGHTVDCCASARVEVREQRDNQRHRGEDQDLEDREQSTSHWFCDVGSDIKRLPA